MADVAGEPPKVVNPYKVLGLSKTSTATEVKTAYKKLALKHHPDKVADSARSSAHAKFQEIAFAYAILSDPTRRNRYDTTGSTSESVPDDFNWKSFFKAQYAETVTSDKLNNFKSTYQGSEEEKRDVIAAYKKRKGNLTKLFKDVMLSNPLDDEDRFKAIIDAAIAAGEAEPFDAYYNADPRERRDRIRVAQREGKEALELAKELGVHDSLFGNGRPEGQEKKGLAELIQQRQKARAATFLDDLTAKYVNGAGQKGAARGKKRKPEESEEEISSTVAQPRKKGKSTKKRKANKPKANEWETESGDEDEIDVSEQPIDEPSEEAFQEVASRPLKQRRRQVVEEDSEAEESLGDEDTDEDQESEEEVKPKRSKVKPK
ncbi:MAG: hypothetical protein HETSPECPRED_006516, partial [Heterodermia speciosa]